MVAQEAKYHEPCLASLYNKATALQVQADDDDDTKVSHGIAVAELLLYINEARLDDKKKMVFTLADLAKLYSARLEQLQNQACPPSLSQDGKLRMRTKSDLLGVSRRLLYYTQT